MGKIINQTKSNNFDLHVFNYDFFDLLGLFELWIQVSLIRKIDFSLLYYLYNEILKGTPSGINSRSFDEHE